MYLRTLLTVLGAVLILTACNPGQDRTPALIPHPVEMKLNGGHFRLKQDTRISWSGGVAAAIMAEELASTLRPATGFELATAEGTDGDIRLVIDASAEWREEEYRLKVQRKSVTLTAGTSEGLFRGIQTVRQLLPPQVFGNETAAGLKWTMPCFRLNW